MGRKPKTADLPHGGPQRDGELAPITAMMSSRLMVLANLLNAPLVAAMFLGEYLYRILRYPNFSHASIRSSIRAFQKHGGSGPAPGR